MHRRTATAALVLSVCAACGGSGSAQSAPTPVAPPTAPRPVVTVVRNSHVVHVGQSVRLDAQQGISLRLTARGPSVSRNRLSSTHGYPPSHGYYVTFHLVIANLGSQPVELGPSNFVVAIPHEGRVTTDDGNAPYSGASAQLDTTQIDPGDVLRSPITFDVRSTTGQLLFVPDRSPAIVWRF